MSKKNYIDLSTEAMEFLNGELLGDGCLNGLKYNNKITSARFTYGSKYKKYIYWLRNELDDIGIIQSGKIGEYIGQCNNKKFLYSSKSYVELSEVYKKWYPNGKKIVPKDIKLTPTTVRQWFIGDGSYNLSRFRLEFATCAFTKDDINILIDRFSNLDLKCYENNNRVFINAESYLDFFDYIGGCPEEIIDIYGYKWPTKDERMRIEKIRRREEKASDTYRNKQWLINQYMNLNKNAYRISEEFSIPRTCVYRYINKFNLKEVKELKKEVIE